MDRDLWERVEKLFHSAIEIEKEHRGTFLAEACEGDSELRREVESLLAAREAAGDYFTQNAVSLPSITSAGDDQQASAPAPELAAIESERRGRRRPKAFWVAMAAFAVTAFYYLLTCTLVFQYGYTDKFGFQTQIVNGQQQISEVHPQGPATGKLQVGDCIIDLDGDTRFSRVDPFVRLRTLPTGQSYAMRVQRLSEGASGRQSEDLQMELTCVSYPHSDAARWRISGTYLSRALICLIVAFFIVWLKPEERFSHLAFSTFLLIAVIALRQVLDLISVQFTGSTRWTILIFWAFTGGHLFIAPAYHAAYLFPPEVFRKGRFWTFLQWVFYGCIAVGFTRTMLVTLIGDGLQQIDLLFDYAGRFYAIRTFADWYYPLGLVALSAVLIRNFGRTEDPQHRRRIKWVIVGTLIASFALMSVEMARLILDALELSYITVGDNFILLDWIANTLVLVFPGIWAYAIFNRQIYDVSVVVRRSVQYLLARNALRVLLALPVLGLLYTVLPAPKPGEVIANNPVFLVLLLLTVLGLIFRRQLSSWLDRRFFREAYNQEQTLLALLDEIRVYDSVGEAARRVSKQLEASLHPRCAHFFFRKSDSDALTLSYSSGGAARHLNIPVNSSLWRLLQSLERQETTFDFPLPGVVGLPSHERQWLNELQVSLLVPISYVEGPLSGWLMLGHKKSEEPYSPTDRKLLLAIARQMALVGEMAALREQLREDEKVKREVLTRLRHERVNLLRECPECLRCFDEHEQMCADCTADLALTLPVERTLAERYRLDQRIGQGGMGTVYRAMDLRLHRNVAIKVLSGALFGDAIAVRRFEREARAAARLDHPNVVVVHDHGTTTAGGAWMALEYVRGVTLREELKRVGQLQLPVALDWFLQLVAGVGAAHAAGIIHRDLKPDNVMIVDLPSGERQVRILDFGLARVRRTDEAQWSETHSLTAPGILMGTPAYMAPEQFDGGEADERTDIFALGVLLAEMLTGQHPFDRKSYGATRLAITQEPYHLTGEDTILRRLDAVLQKCLAKEPRARYARLESLQEELLPMLRECSAEFIVTEKATLL